MTVVPDFIALLKVTVSLYVDVEVSITTGSKIFYLNLESISVNSFGDVT